MPNPTAEIILTTSRHMGLVAITHGGKYQQANRALEEAGFARLPNGASTAPLTDPQAARRTASALVHHAHAHGATITTSTRPYLGDFGTEIAARLPGTWSAELEIYSHPLWQEDLWPMLWEAGEMYRALEDHRIPFASVLKNGSGTELLLIERPGHRSGYLLGALTDRKQEDPHDDPTTPHSIVLPADPGLAARAIADTFLPAHRRALHHQDLNNVLRALERIREEHQTLQVIKESGRYSARASRPRRPARDRDVARRQRSVRAPGPRRRTGWAGRAVRAHPANPYRPPRAPCPPRAPRWRTADR